ncbi:putative thiamine biosynthesis enzyme [Microbacterium sp. TS-1]|nr:putative thiamine biosynthesis enzyme [Microbacterium sp. TS-1]
MAVDDDIPPDTGMTAGAVMTAGSPQSSTKRFTEIPPTTMSSHVTTVRAGHTSREWGDGMLRRRVGRMEVRVMAQVYARRTLPAMSPHAIHTTDGWILTASASRRRTRLAQPGLTHKR